MLPKKSHSDTGSSLEAGFSLVELMVVVGIIGVLTTLSQVGYDNYHCKVKEKERIACLTKAARYIEVESIDGPIMNISDYNFKAVCNLPNFSAKNDLAALDVTKNGIVSSADASRIIAKLGAFNNLGALQVKDFPTDRYYDINGDGRISQLDALVLINWIGRNGTTTYNRRCT